MFRKRLAFAVLTLATLAGTCLYAPPAKADRFSIGFSYSSGSRYRHRPRYRRIYRPVRYYRPRYRRVIYQPVVVARHRCGCGDRFASAYWLDYHQDHGCRYY